MDPFVFFFYNCNKSKVSVKVHLGKTDRTDLKKYTTLFLIKMIQSEDDKFLRCTFCHKDIHLQLEDKKGNMK